MAGPFSVTGTTVSLIVLGLTVVRSLYNLSTELRNAGREIRDLSVEAATLKELLDRLYGILNQADLCLGSSQEQHLQIVLGGCINVFAELHTQLELFFVDGKGRGKRTVQKMRWMLKKEDIRELLQRVEKLKNNLQTVLLISQREMLGEIGSKLSQHIYDLDFIRRNLDIIASTRLEMQDQVAATRCTTQRVYDELQNHIGLQLREITDGFTVTVEEIHGLRNEFRNSMKLVLARLLENKNDMIQFLELSSRKGKSPKDTAVRRKRIKVRGCNSVFGLILFTTTTIRKHYQFRGFSTHNKSTNHKFMYFLPSLRLWSAGLSVSFASTPFQISVGDLMAVKLMLEKREIMISDIELDYDDEKAWPRSRGTLLHVAARHGHRRLCDFLVSQGADPDLTVKIYSPETPIARVGTMLLAKETSALELSNPLYMPSTFSDWDDPCPSPHSLSSFVTRMWEQIPSAAPQMVQSAIQHFTLMIQPELKRGGQIDVTNAFAYGMMRTHGTSDYIAYKKILSSIQIYEEVRTTPPGFEEIIYRTPPKVFMWPVDKEQPPDETMLKEYESRFGSVQKHMSPVVISAALWFSSRRVFEQLCAQMPNGPNALYDNVFQFCGFYQRQLRTGTIGSLDPAGVAEFIRRLRYLRSLGLDINVKDDAGRTALHNLFIFGFDGHTALRLRNRIEAGADSTIVDAYGWPPLFYAIFFGNIPAVVQLLTKVTNSNTVVQKARYLAREVLIAARQAPENGPYTVKNKEWQKWPQWMCSNMNIAWDWKMFRTGRGISKSLLIRQYQCVVDTVEYFSSELHEETDQELDDVLEVLTLIIQMQSSVNRMLIYC
ncbi:hypothetical protein BDD12DRAFT_894497 [Trichophaea hybrida]|nr:hypothetical protein BDD12DRAFT_894497 [Trichophaea hybrida]